MNLYFLVEGRRTEAKVYPAWLRHLLPDHNRVMNAWAADKSNYYLFSGEGYPSILSHLKVAIEEINEIGKYQFLLVCVDADEATVEERETEIYRFLHLNRIRLRGCELKIIVQNRAIESWFLGNE
ncbi:MAG TPA: hypothetical protein ENJ82_14840, partial [Bacteroidetes bacterium]|nr:hypothetical protein [Bacteroidota bacterium]